MAQPVLTQAFLQLAKTAAITLFSLKFLHKIEKLCINNPLTTDDECTYDATLTACYHSVQPILKTGFSLLKECDRGR